MDDVNVIFANMNIHTSTICLHQAAIFKAEKNKMSNQIVTESKRRCLVAANQISSIMKMVSHVDLTIVGLGRGRYLGNFQTFELTDF
jgi:DNA-binding transcriptional regulator LsrR (DeoR family)